MSASIRDSRLPRGTCSAPGRWPSCHSSCSRTSSSSGRSPSSRRPSTSDEETSSISSLTCARSSRYVAITFKSIASRSLSHRLSLSDAVRRLSNRWTGSRAVGRGYRAPVSARTRTIVVVAVVAAGGRWRRRRHHRGDEQQSQRGCRAGPDGPRRCAAAVARPRRARRPGGRRSPQGDRALRRRQARRGRSALRPARLARGADRRVVQQLARRHRRRSHAALGAAPEERRRAAQPRDRAILGRRGRSRGRLEVGGRARAGHAPTPSRPATCCTRASRATCRSSSRAKPFPRPCAGSPRRRSSRSSSVAPGTGTSQTASSTASRCSGSASSARRSASTRRPRGSRRRTPRRASPPPSGSSTRHARRAPSRTSGPLSRTFPERRDRALPPRSAAALVGPGEGGTPPARARPRRSSRARRSSASRSSTSTSCARRASEPVWGIFLTSGVSDRYGHEGSMERGGSERS